MGAIQEFVSKYYDAQRYLSDHDVERASKAYRELLATYEKITQEGSTQDKAIAHEQLTTLYYQLQEPPKSVAPYLAVGLVVVLLSFVAVVQPSIVGLPIFPETIYQDINVATSRTGFLNVTLEGIPTSLYLKASGQGKVYLVQGKNLVRVWEGGEEYACEDSCLLDGIDTNKIVLLVETKDMIRLEKIKYTARPLPNNPPTWVGKQTTYAAPVTLNLSALFIDEDGDDMVFLSSNQPGLRVTIRDEILTIVPLERGKRDITLYASDLKSVTKQPITITA